MSPVGEDRHAAAGPIKVSSSKKPNKEPSGNPEGISEIPEGRVVLCRAVPLRRSQRTRCRADRSLGRRRGDRQGSQSAKRSSVKAPAKYEINGSRPGGPNPTV